METFSCVDCRCIISIKDFTSGLVKQKNDKLYCADCLAEKRPRPQTICPHCKHNDTPLHDGKSYLCRKCGGTLHSLDNLALATSNHSSSKGSAKDMSRKKCPFCAEYIPFEAVLCRHCNSSLQENKAPLTVSHSRETVVPWVLLSVGVLFAIGLAAYTFFANEARTRTEEKRKNESISQQVLALDTEIHKVTEEFNSEIKKVTEQTNEVSAAYTRLSTSLPESIVEEVKSSAKLFDRRFKETDHRIIELNAALKGLLQNHEEITEKLSEISTQFSALQSKKDEEDAKKSSSSSTIPEASWLAYCKAENQALNYLKTYQFGNASRAFDNFLILYSQSPYHNQAVEKKNWYRTYAHEVYEDLKKQADTLLSKGKHDLALKKFKQVMDFGIAELTREAQRESARINALRARRSKASIKFKSPSPPIIESKSSPSLAKDSSINVPRNVAEKIPSRKRNEKSEHLAVGISDWVKILESKKGSTLQRKDAVRSLSQVKGNRALAALVGALKDEDWGIQAEAIRAIGKRGDLTVVDHIIEKLGHQMLPVRHEAHLSLKTLTENDLGDDRKAWKQWWEQNREKFGVPPRQLKLKVNAKLNLPASSVRNLDSAFVLALYPKMNSLLLSCGSIDPFPKKGETFTVKREDQLIGEIEVTDLGPGIAKAVIIKENPGKTIQEKDTVARLYSE